MAHFYLNNNDLFPQKQYVFREGNSIVDQILFFVQRVRDSEILKPLHHTITVFFDLTMGFDKV